MLSWSEVSLLDSTRRLKTPFTFQERGAGGAPHHLIPSHTGYGGGGVVERSLSVTYPRRHKFLFLLLCTFFLRLTCHSILRLILCGLAPLCFIHHQDTKPQSYVLEVAFLRTAIAPRRGPLRVQAFVCVR